MKLLFALIALLLSLPATAGLVVTREFDSSALQRKWTYAVYLPDGYDTSTLRYPVLYLLHGRGGGLYDWVNLGHIQQTADELIAHGDIPPAIIVMPDADSTWYVDRKEKMETAMIRDLVGDAERNFRALGARDGRLVAGLSMGGYGALRFVLKYPEMFAAAALLSPAIYDPEPPQGSGARKAGVFGAPDFDPQVWKELNYPALWDAFLAKKTAVPMYINSGDDDTLFIEAEATRLYSLLRKNGQPAELRIVDGGHDWQVWEKTIGDALRYIFRFSARPATAPADAAKDAKARKSR
ncbi:MAG TPA: alpha/beta hydrolase family protein [Steroidobacteraceae bacterium]|jgi:enterochelin esterase-like enzyme|nr:alpha/beta hydrolase family protein [Steroidobacteraceae bacterium]